MNVCDAALLEFGLSKLKFRLFPFLKLLLERRHRWSSDTGLHSGRPLPVERKESEEFIVPGGEMHYWCH